MFNYAYLKMSVSHNKEVVETLKELLGDYDISVQNNLIHIVAEDHNDFTFTLKQIRLLLLNDFGYSSKILIVPFFHEEFIYYLNLFENDCLTAFDIAYLYEDNPIVKKSINALMSYLGHENINNLKEYMNNNCDSNETASQLYLHRNSFAYRLKMIVEKKRFEYNDINSMMWLKLSLSIVNKK